MASLSDIQNLLAAALKRKSDELQSQLAARDEFISKLMQKVDLADPAPTTDSQTPGKSHSCTMKQKAIGKYCQRTWNLKIWYTNPKCAVSPKPSSPKANLFQIVSKDMPESFTATRDALYTHIKLIWNLLEQKAIPREDANTASLIPIQEVVTLKNLQKGQKKAGKCLVNMDEFFINYTQATLARLGIRVWAPDLEDSPHSLYNEACRQAALKSFRQVAASGAYAYMNINKKYTTDLQLLIPAYNHYVHFLQTNQFNREKHQLGKFRQDEERKVIKRARTIFEMPNYNLLLPNLF
ncbi:hypothetical protein VP01_6572g2 [Puccinia sorghi]|uniref:Uncharacterized protein n=1 Tax=Puccinia sorghi TaxID=27349 RepID=A0A0L6UHG3_9BASI|nr:hypothetical protein VP01_6572g2 [Puccinia sorghi]